MRLPTKAAAATLRADLLALLDTPVAVTVTPTYYLGRRDRPGFQVRVGGDRGIATHYGPEGLPAGGAHSWRRFVTVTAAHAQRVWQPGQEYAPPDNPKIGGLF